LGELFSEIAKEVLIKELVPELSKLIGERSAQAVAFKIISDATTEAFRKLGLELPKDACEVFKYAYEELEGGKVECEESDGRLVVRVKYCPLIVRYGRDPNVCLVSSAIKRGLIKAIFGKDAFIITKDHKYGNPKAPILIRKKKTLVEGDDECLFEVEIKG